MKGSTESWELNSSKKCIQRLESSTTSLGVLGEVVVLICLLNDYKQALRRGLRSCSVYRAYNALLSKLSKVVKSCQKLSYIVIHCHTLSYIVIRCHTLSYVVIRCPTLSYVVIHCHTLSYVAICCHTLSYVVICCHKLS